MKPEAEILRALLPPLFAPGDPVRLPPSRAETLILAVARHHKLSPALAALPGANLPPALMSACEHDRFLTLAHATLLRHSAMEVLAELRRVDVATILLKGMAYEHLLYPAPGTRPATDVDLLIHPQARPTAFRIFRALGFEPAAGGPGFDQADYHEVTLRRGDVFIDLHFALAPLQRCSIDYAALWRHATTMQIEGVEVSMLWPPHAAVHHALHMAVHHFDVPGLYLLDMARLLAEPGVARDGFQTAREWRCLRPWQTATALTADFIPLAGRILTEGVTHARSGRVIRAFGPSTPLTRSEQLRRKVEHFDSVTDVGRYLLVQGRRGLRERWISMRGAPSAAQRLGWDALPPKL